MTIEAGRNNSRPHPIVARATTIPALYPIFSTIQPEGSDIRKYAPKKQNCTSSERKFDRWNRSLKCGTSTSFNAVIKPMPKYNETISISGTVYLALLFPTVGEAVLTVPAAIEFSKIGF